MIERKGKLIVITCDGCEREEESDHGEDFETFWDKLKKRGWRSKSLSGRSNGAAMWVNLCPSCARREG